jgi:anti-sigma regulatory factor (Ser/Thr protein kinase)
MDLRPTGSMERAEWGGGTPVQGCSLHTTATEATADRSPNAHGCEATCSDTNRRDTNRKELYYRLRRADLSAVAEARRLLRDHLRSWNVSGLADTAELLTSELVTNALIHTDHGAELTATLTGGPVRRLRVEVYDFASRHPKLRKASDQADSGRGMLLVQALADSWGVRQHGAGKIVWFELAATCSS